MALSKDSTAPIPSSGQLSYQSLSATLLVSQFPALVPSSIMGLSTCLLQPAGTFDHITQAEVDFLFAQFGDYLLRG